jgi:amino acid transporter
MGDAAGAAKQAADKGKDAARTIEGSSAYQWLVKVGLVFYGIVHLLVAVTAVRMALGLRGSDEEASNTGALRSLAETPLGAGLLWVVAAGFFALVVWQAVTALIGFHEFDGFKRVRKRLSAALRTVLYGYLGVAAARIASGPDVEDGEDAQESLSQGLLGLPFGQVLVGIVGLAVLGYAIAQVSKAFRKSFHDELDTTLTGAKLRLTQAGFVGKGIAIGIVGALFLWAALDADAQKAGGLDKALQQVLQQPLGMLLLLALALGIGAYGIYCFFWARHPKHA